MSEWKNGKAVVYEDRHGNTRCGACYAPLWCNDCGDMPETCPQCGAPLDYSFYDEPSKESTEYKRTIREPDGEHIIIYQGNGWQQHIKVYDDGSREEWLEPDHQ